MTYSLITGDAYTELKKISNESINCCVTSPPYFQQRNYQIENQIGLESLADYIQRLVDVFEEVRRVLTPDGTLWLNLGDSYASGTLGRNDKIGKGKDVSAGKKYEGQKANSVSRNCGLKPKNLIGVPWRVALALQEAGWILRSDIIWNKKSCMPEAVTDRPTKSHEYIFLFSKSPKYFYDLDSIREPYAEATRKRNQYPQHDIRTGVVGKLRDGKQKNVSKNGAPHRSDIKLNPLGRNRRTVWTVCPSGYKEAHFATYPPELIRPCVKAGCPACGTVLDPFSGAATTGVVCLQEGKNYLGIELNPQYNQLAEHRLSLELQKLQANP